MRDHAEHDLSVDNLGCLQCLTCLKTLTSTEDPLVPHKRHRLTVDTGPGPTDERFFEPFTRTIRCLTCQTNLVEAASFLYSIVIPEDSRLFAALLVWPGQSADDAFRDLLDSPL